MSLAYKFGFDLHFSIYFPTTEKEIYTVTAYNTRYPLHGLAEPTPVIGARRLRRHFCAASIDQYMHFEKRREYESHLVQEVSTPVVQ